MTPSSLVCTANCQAKHKPCLISGLRSGLNEAFALRGVFFYQAALVVSYCLTIENGSESLCRNVGDLQIQAATHPRRANIST